MMEGVIQNSQTKMADSDINMLWDMRMGMAAAVEAIPYGCNITHVCYDPGSL